MSMLVPNAWVDTARWKPGIYVGVAVTCLLRRSDLLGCTDSPFLTKAGVL
jgi:hypothetical protein